MNDTILIASIKFTVARSHTDLYSGRFKFQPLYSDGVKVPIDCTRSAYDHTPRPVCCCPSLVEYLSTQYYLASFFLTIMTILVLLFCNLVSELLSLIVYIRTSWV